MKIIDLKKQTGQFCLNINNIDFEKCKVHGIIGSNGSGKTTLTKIIMGITEQDSGYIDYDGLLPRDITMTGQKPYLIHTSVYQNIIYPLRIRKMPIDEEVVDDWLTRLDMLGKKHQYALSLSSGEQQKISFIRAIIFSPKLIILDETLSNLDPDSAQIIQQIIADTQKTKPITWIIISHQLVHIRDVCDCVHFLHNGQNIDSGTVEDMLLKPKNPLVVKYLSRSQVILKE